MLGNKMTQKNGTSTEAWQTQLFVDGKEDNYALVG